ncbi:restriction endonuclease subunit S [Lactiplantibacillus plantarum]|uniref:restriction endonuclease subunit S n=1 Tax=Lactiplantibacillus plantarum TaxID=1590 RepID=UPI0018EC0CE3|nr:restriction endonuclease subunit S [Lactiplantibacillus plantarum]MCG0593523.1 restriction endonuclease subunit S [Lactiplantibacillus plantarum]MCG0672123.1 restriction endonuclease subunit S [Lactiplantibacillus plantarum]MCG0872860.1 restriction endonuclease subunit S [Lactiplantibacillus plantarum]MCG0921435.1 restriction endonuclease subunit S [Lactiplantibacillus plantarum]UNF78208.1 restriction endonuclease subunit S [Lactiplantibacillus plantarum]
MKDNQAKYPQLRFKGFTDPWEDRKFFESIASIIDFRGRTPKKLGMDWSESGYLALSALNVKNGYIDPLADAHYGDENLYKKWMSGKELKKGQVLFTTEAPMGNVAQVPDNNGYILSQRTVAFETKEDMMTNDFLAVLLKSPLVFNNLSALSSGGTAKGVSQKSLKGLSITAPFDIDEQQTIGSFFKQLDDTIALHQRKLAKLKELKQGYLQKLFPKNGSKFPQLRFAGFADAWEQRKLNQLTNSVYQGINTAADKVKYSVSGVPILQAKHITDGNLNFNGVRFLNEQSYNSYFPKYSPQKGDILFANIGTIGPSVIVDSATKFLIAWNILKLSVVSDVYAKFIQYQLVRLNGKHYFSKIVTGNATKFINKDDLLNVQFEVPLLDEQKEISKILMNIDQLIAANQRKLEKLQELKKGYLQKMFC